MKRALRACALIFVLVLVACDGGGEQATNGESESDGGITHAEYVEKVDAICADDRARLQELEPPTNLEESGPFLRKILPVIRDQIAAVRDLGEPPAERRDIFFQWLEARDGIVETTAQMIGAAEDGEEKEFGRLGAIQQDLDRAADKAAAAYGLKVCGSSG